MIYLRVRIFECQPEEEIFLLCLSPSFPFPIALIRHREGLANPPDAMMLPMSFPPPQLNSTPSSIVILLVVVISVLVTVGAFAASIWFGLWLADLDVLTWKQCVGIASGLTALRIVDRTVFKSVKSNLSE